jgi:small conductance mechanosensitive channel
VEFSTEPLITYGVQLAFAVGILVGGRALVGLGSNLIERAMMRAKVDPTLTTFAVRLSSMFMMAVVVIAALSQLGIETTSLVAVIGAAGLAIALSLQGALSNFASGVILIAFRPFNTGDFVETGGVKGRVKAIHIINTQLITPDNRHVVIPNSQVLGGSITNYNKYGTRRIDLVIGVGYSDDLRKAREVLERVVSAQKGILDSPEPVIAVSELADSSVNFVVRPWCNTSDYWKVRWALTEAIKLGLDDAGISIPFPQRDLHLVDIPEALLNR